MRMKEIINLNLLLRQKVIHSPHLIIARIAPHILAKIMMFPWTPHTKVKWYSLTNILYFSLIVHNHGNYKVKLMSFTHFDIILVVMYSAYILAFNDFEIELLEGVLDVSDSVKFLRLVEKVDSKYHPNK